MTAQASFGLDVQIGNGASAEIFTSVGDMVDVGLPETTGETKDVSTHESADQFREFMAVMLDGGSLDFVMRLQTKTELDTLYDVVNGLANHNWKILMPSFLSDDGNQHGVFFAGPLTRVKPVGSKVEDTFDVECSIKISGKPTFSETYWHDVVEVDVSGGGTAQTTAIVTIPDGATIDNVIAEVTEAFDGDTSTTFEVGIAGNTDKYLDPVDVDPTALAQYDMLTGTNNDQQTAETVAEDTAIIATWTNEDNESAGTVKVHVFWEY